MIDASTFSGQFDFHKPTSYDIDRTGKGFERCLQGWCRGSDNVSLKRSGHGEAIYGKRDFCFYERFQKCGLFASKDLSLSKCLRK